MCVRYVRHKTGPSYADGGRFEKCASETGEFSKIVLPVSLRDRCLFLADIYGNSMSLHTYLGVGLGGWGGCYKQLLKQHDALRCPYTSMTPCWRGPIPAQQGTDRPGSPHPVLVQLVTPRQLLQPVEPSHTSEWTHKPAQFGHR